MDDKPLITVKEIAAMFADPELAAKYPPIMTIEQAAELVHTPVQTLNSWSSQGLLRDCSRRPKKRLLILRDKFINKIFNGDLNGEG